MNHTIHWSFANGCMSCRDISLSLLLMAM